MTRPAFRPIPRQVHNPVPRVPGKIKGANDSEDQAVQQEELLQQQQNIPQGAFATNVTKSIITPQGALSVNFSNNNGILTPTAITKNVSFNAPINQTQGNLALTGTQTYTYQLKGNQIIPTLTNQQGTLTYNNAPVANLTPSGSLVAIPGAKVSVAQYATISGQNQLLGNIIETPTIQNNQLSFNFQSFQPSTVTETYPLLVTPPTGASRTIGITLQTQPTFNAQTGQISLNFPSPTLPPGYSVSGLPPATTFYSSTPGVITTPKPLLLYSATAIGNNLLVPPANTGSISATQPLTAFGINFNVPTPTSTILQSVTPQALQNLQSQSVFNQNVPINSKYTLSNNLFLTTQTQTTNVAQIFTTQTLTNSGVLSTSASAVVFKATPNLIKATGNYLFALVGEESPLNNISIPNQLTSTASYAYGLYYGAQSAQASILSTPYELGQFAAQQNPNASLPQKLGLIANYAVNTAVSLTPPAQAIGLVQSVKTQGVIQTSEQVGAAVLLFGALGVGTKGIYEQVFPVPKGTVEINSPLISSRPVLSQEPGLIVTKGLSQETELNPSLEYEGYTKLLSEQQVNDLASTGRNFIESTKAPSQVTQESAVNLIKSYSETLGIKSPNIVFKELPEGQIARTQISTGTIEISPSKLNTAFSSSIESSLRHEVFHEAFQIQNQILPTTNSQIGITAGKSLQAVTGIKFGTRAFAQNFLSLESPIYKLEGLTSPASQAAKSYYVSPIGDIVSEDQIPIGAISKNVKLPAFDIISTKPGILGSIEFREVLKVTYPNAKTDIDAIGISRSITTTTEGSERTLLTGGSVDVITRTYTTSTLRNIFNAPRVITSKATLPTTRGIVTDIGTKEFTTLTIQNAPVYPGELKGSFITGQESSGEVSILRFTGTTSGRTEYSGVNFKVTGYSKSGEVNIESVPFQIFESKELLPYSDLAYPKPTIPPEQGYTGEKLQTSIIPVKQEGIIESIQIKNIASSDIRTQGISKPSEQVTITKERTAFKTQTPFISTDQLLEVSKQGFKQPRATTIPLVPQLSNSFLIKNITSPKLQTSITSKIVSNTTSKSKPIEQIQNKINTKSSNKITTNQTNKLLNSQPQKLYQANTSKLAQPSTQKTITTTKTINTQKIATSANTLGIQNINTPFVLFPGNRKVRPPKIENKQNNIFKTQFTYVSDLAHQELNIPFKGSKKQKRRLGNIAYSRPK